MASGKVSDCDRVVQPSPICGDGKMAVYRCLPFSSDRAGGDKMPQSRCAKHLDTYPRILKSVTAGKGTAMKD